MMNVDKLPDDRPVLLISYERYDEARRLMTLLESCDIPCFLQNELTNNVFGMFCNVGGYRIEIPESRVSEVLELLDNEGITLPDETDSTIGALNRSFARGRFLRGKTQQQKLLILLGLSALGAAVIALLIYLITAVLL